MSLQRPDPETLALVGRYVVWSADRRRYMKLLGGNPLREMADRDVFDAALAADARQITDEDLGKLLAFEWRARLVAAWLIGLDRRTRFRPGLGDLLLKSELVHSGKGYCFALARFGQPEDADILAAYLDRYLPRRDCHYDQLWALGALLHLDDELGTDHAERFIAPSGAWHQSAFADFDPLECQRRTQDLCGFADRIMTPSG